jgi:hypothetical protein
VSANITRDPETGIGNWDEEVFRRNSSTTGRMRNTAVRNYPARRRSLSCDGWISRKKTPEEVDVIYTYRRSVAPVRNAVETHPELSEEDAAVR